MAKGRIIDKGISLSDKVADLDLLGKLLYTWMIPHADDLGLHQASARAVKALVLPMEDYLTKVIEERINQLVEIGLLKYVEYEKKKYLYIVDFEKKQTLRRDRQPVTILPFKAGATPKESWEKLEKIALKAIGVHLNTSGLPDDNQADTNDIPVVHSWLPENKINKNKLNKINTVNIGNGFLKKLPNKFTDESYISYITDLVEEKTGDKKSRKAFAIVAAKIPEAKIQEWLSEIKVDGARNKGAVLIDKAKKYAESL